MHGINDLESADVEGFTSRALIYDRENLSLFCLLLLLRGMRPEAHWSGLHSLYQVGAPQTSLDTSKRSLEGVCTSCTNQAHYSLVRMCTPCSNPHPPPNWRSRSRVVVTSSHVLFGSGTGAVHTHGPHIRMSVFHVHLVPLHHPVLSLIPL